MCPHITALLGAQDTCTLSTSEVGESINLIPMQGLVDQKALMLFPMMLSNDQCFIQENTRDEFVAQMHAQRRPGCNWHDDLLVRIKMEANPGVYMIFEPVSIS